VDLLEKKSMNTHLHLLEAYTNLARYWRDPYLLKQLEQLIDNFCSHIIHPKTHHFILFFNETWTPRSEVISFGPDIEGSWLLTETSEVMKNKSIIAQIKKRALQLAQVTLDEGLIPDGGIYYEQQTDGHKNQEMQFWTVAEAVVGFLNSYEMSKNIPFLQAAHSCWQFIEKYLVDREHGEWHYKILPDKTVDTSMDKVSEWKGPYHTSRTCLEIMQRTERLLQELQ
jgi:mannobiose 2-epimerase